MKKFVFILIAGLFYTSPSSALVCGTAPDCAEMGYNKSAADCSGEYLKCPFDTSKVACIEAGANCSDYGFLYDCTGTGYASGSGTACDSKYTACTCSSGYEWRGSACSKILAIGDILYSDMTVSDDLISGKTAIGVVFDATNRYAVALTNASSYMTWGGYGTDISGLENCTSSSTVTTTCGTNGKSNTQTIIAQGGSYPAASYCNSYSTAGTSAGDWWLPSLKDLNTIYTNKTAINAGLTKAGGTTLTENWYWSSTEYGSGYAWGLTVSYGTGLDGKGNNFYVRAVAAF